MPETANSALRFQLVLSDPGLPRYCARCGVAMPAPLSLADRPVCPRCGWTYYAKNATGAAALVERSGKVLLVRRKHEPYAGWWHLPSGFVEYGEDAATTTVREAQEETGLVVAVTALFGVYFGGDDPRNPSHLIVYRVRELSGELHPGDDAEAAEFFAPEALPDQIAFEANRAALREWQRAG